MLGVGFYINKNGERLSLNKTVTSRVVMASLNFGKKCVITIMQVHAPTCAATDREIEDFYNIIDEIMQQERRKTRLFILMRDFNARIGSRTDGEEQIIETSSYGQRNERGNLLVHCALKKCLKIGTTFFPKPNKNKGT